MTFGKYHIPFKIHIKDISFKEDERLELGLLGKDNDPFFQEFQTRDEMNYYRKFFKYINTEDKLYSMGMKNFYEFNEMKSLDELFHILDNQDFRAIAIRIIPFEAFMVDVYRERLYDALKIEAKEPDIKYTPKNQKPEDVREFLKQSQEYIITQVFKEYNPTIFFDENIGKAVYDFSYRELELHNAYITRKTMTDNVANKWEASCIEGNKK